MKNIVLIIAFALLTSQQVFAQYVPESGTGIYSPTIVLPETKTKASDIWINPIDVQAARRMAIDNWSSAVDVRRAQERVGQEYQREKWEEKYSIDARSKRLDKMEELHALRQREADLRGKGVLPPRPKPAFGYKGKVYSSYSEFKKSPEWADLIREGAMREYRYNYDKAVEAERHRNAVAFERERRQYSPTTIYLRDQRDAERGFADNITRAYVPSIKRYKVLEK